MKIAEYKKGLPAGFTLIEMLIYALIFMIFVGGMVSLASALLTTSQRANTQIEVSDNAQFLTQKLQRAIQGATSIDFPAIGASAPSISITTASASANPLVIDLADGVVRIKKSSGAAIPITNSYVIVSSLSFTNYSYSAMTKNTVRARAIITSVEPYNPASTSIDFFISIR